MGNLSESPKGVERWDIAGYRNKIKNMEIRCEKCGQEESQIKNGKTKAGSQRYKCNHCGKTYTPVKKERMYPEELKDRAIELYMEGNSGRTVGRLLKISKNMKDQYKKLNRTFKK